MTTGSQLQELETRLHGRSATVGVIGLGYVGLPLAVAVARAGFRTIGIDTDPSKPEQLNAGQSYIDAVDSTELARLVAEGRFRATTDDRQLEVCDVIIVCVPTPLTSGRDPDLSYIRSTSRIIAEHLRVGQLVVLESTSYPGTTREVMKPLLEANGLVSGRDFLLAYSPEREDPGNAEFATATIPRVVAGDGPEAAAMVQAFYGAVVSQVVPVSSMEAAEAVKITENVFRAVNIALVNELKVIYAAMGIDVWEVIEAAKTKPFGYMPFYPGPGLGGHCIPIDPFYLAWRARAFDTEARLVELAGEINHAMPAQVVDVLVRSLGARLNLALASARILILGMAYKRNVSDIRESPALALMELLKAGGAEVQFHDPHVPLIPPTRRSGGLQGQSSVELSPADYDAVLIATDHDDIDYDLVFRTSRLVIDTRNVMARRSLSGAHVVKA